MISWSDSGQTHEARWRSESGAAAPRRVVVADDTLPADTAYRLACEGTGLLWQGDFQNARMLLQALMRRVDRKPAKAAAKAAQKMAEATAAEAFHLHRQAQAQRARVLSAVLIPLEGDYGIALRRAPDLRQACTEAWGPATGERSVASLRELLGLVGAHEWRKKGVEVPALGAAPTHWNQGVGLALWDAARDGLHEEGCTNVTAWVPLRNERAIRFHEMAGFKRELSTAKTAVVGGVKIEEVRLKRPIN